MTDDELARFAQHHQAPPPKDLHAWIKEQEELAVQMYLHRELRWSQLWALIDPPHRSVPW